jgi:hypothetical protein
MGFHRVSNRIVVNALSLHERRLRVPRRPVNDLGMMGNGIGEPLVGPQRAGFRWRQFRNY